MYTTDGRRALPAIPLTTTTTTTSQQQQQQQHERPTNLGVPAMIPTWRRSIVDDPDHYSYLEFNQLTSTVEQRQRSPGGGYEGLNPEELALLRQPAAPHDYTGMTGSTQPQSTADPHGKDNRQGYEVLQRPVLEEFRRPHSYPGTDIRSSSRRSGRRRYLEIIDCSSPNNLLVPGMAAGTSEELDPFVVGELRRPRRPHSYAGVETDRSGLCGDVQFTAWIRGI